MTKETRTRPVRPVTPIASALDGNIPRTTGEWIYLNLPFSIAGRIYDAKGFEWYHTPTFDIRGYDWLAAYVGVPDDTNPSVFGSVGTLTVSVDGVPERQWTKRIGETASRVLVPLTGHQTVTLRCDRPVALAEPKLGRGPLPSEPDGG